MRPKNFLLFSSLFIISFSVFSQRPIDTTQILNIGGIKQFVSIKGKNRSSPLLLFLHGGPGNSVMSYAEKFTNKLQEHFVVVQWDQRESGRTLQLNSSPIPLTVDLFKNDTHDLVDALLKQFNRPKLYLAGHSWGTVLGFHIAKHYPNLLYAYIPVCPMIDQLESESIILEKMKAYAEQNKNQVAIKELSTIKIPFQNGEQLYFHRKWLFHYIGSKTKLSKSHVVSWSAIWLSVFNEASNDNLNKSTTALQCPVYFFVGRKDFQTNSVLTEFYFEKLDVPHKELFWFEHSAHSVPSTEPGLFQDIIIEKILPITY